MAGIECFICHKGVMTGRQHKHHPGVAGGRWKRRAPKTQKLFKPNLHTAHIILGNVRKKVRLCTKCLRQVKAEMAGQVKVKGRTKSGTQSPIIPRAQASSI